MTELKKGQRYEFSINGLNHEGQGVGRIGNFAVFVDGAIPGEQIEARLTKVTRNYAAAELLKVIKASPLRTEPFCGSFALCGGCSMQHIDYKGQLSFKKQIVTDSLLRIGKISDVIIHDTLGMGNPYEYRNKAQYPVGFSGGEVIAGFYSKKSHDIVGNDYCRIQDSVSNLVRSVALAFFRKKGIPAYDEKTDKGLIRHIMTRYGFKTGEVMVVIVINGTELPYSDEFTALLAEKIPGLKSIVLNTNTKNTNIIMGKKNTNIFGDGTITDYIGKFRFKISPLSFFQVNPVQTHVLYSKALEYAGLTGRETVFDLYCGIGTISLFLSQKSEKVYGVEIVEEAISDARENASLNDVKNVEFICGEAEKVIPGLYEKGTRADVVVVDPPRKGCDEALLKTLVEMKPERIVYVSCKPSTLARDLRYLEDNGFKTVEVQPVDMFPHTSHTESVARIKRLKGL